MSMQQYCEATDVGCYRDNNEDAILSDPNHGLWLVADGMGGHAAGEVASDLAKSTIQEKVSGGMPLEKAIQLAHKNIIDAMQEGTGREGMGSTVVALQTLETVRKIAWVGDSRAYLWSTADKSFTLKQLSTDHSYVQMLFQAGAITAEEMAYHPEKNIITQCLGSVDLPEVSVDHVEAPWCAGEKVLLCSDGLTDAVSDQDICDVLYQHEDSKAAVPALIKLALDRKARDNISVILVDAPKSALGQFSDKIKSKVQSLFVPKQD